MQPGEDHADQPQHQGHDGPVAPIAGALLLHSSWRFLPYPVYALNNVIRSSQANGCRGDSVCGASDERNRQICASEEPVTETPNEGASVDHREVSKGCTPD